MKRSLILAGLLVMVPALAFAQIPMMPGALEFSATGGASVPAGDFGNAFGTGYGLGASGAFYVMPNLALGASLAYNSYAADDSWQTLGVDPSDVSMSILEMTAYGKYMFMPGPVSPYAKAAAGMFRGKAEIQGVGEASNDMGIGGGVGAQLRIPTSNIGLFAEGMAYSVFTEGSSTTYYAIRGGINFYINPKP
jgi:hypothetical protein